MFSQFYIYIKAKTILDSRNIYICWYYLPFKKEKQKGVRSQTTGLTWSKCSDYEYLLLPCASAMKSIYPSIVPLAPLCLCQILGSIQRPKRIFMLPSITIFFLLLLLGSWKQASIRPKHKMNLRFGFWRGPKVLVFSLNCFPHKKEM